LPNVSGKRVTIPHESNASIANNTFELRSILSNIPKIIGLKDDAKVPKDEAILPPIALDLIGYNSII
jgi:hypothetical protein